MNKIRQSILLDLLRRDNKITPVAFDTLTQALNNGEDPIEIILKEESVSKTDIHKAIQEYVNAPYVNLDTVDTNIDFNDFLGLDLLKQYNFIPLYRFEDGTWVFGSTKPEDPFLNRILLTVTSSKYLMCSVDADKLTDYFNVYSASLAAKNALKSIQSETSSSANRGDGMSAEVANAPAVRFIDSTLEEAVKVGASDIHVEPSETRVLIRYRIDGDLQEKAAFDISFFPTIATRIKILADIDIAEKRIPQDGHITKFIGNDKYDFRVSTLPTIHGEKFVIRVLDKKIFSLSLAELHFSKEVNETIDKILHHPHGIILLTGPTGSGKTTTLYSFLRELNKPNVNIITVEDPVEYSMESINQIQINNKADLTFASALRSILRQDPDIIMVGEIRDEETAQIAIRAAITGHLVLSTLHTNEAPGAITRLIDMGVPEYLVADALVAVISQRLIRRLCPRCKRPVKPTEDQMRVLGLKNKDAVIYEANGCPYCNNGGYKGRLAVHEIMYMNDDIRATIAEKEATVEEIRDVAITKAGMIPLFDAAKQVVIDGNTSYNDLLSMIVTEERERKPAKTK